MAKEYLVVWNLIGSTSAPMNNYVKLNGLTKIDIEYMRSYLSERAHVQRVAVVIVNMIELENSKIADG